MSKRIYTHKHHIIPRHAGGSNDPSNLVELTTEEHALAHKKLFFAYGRWQDEIAYLTLSGQIGKEEAHRRVLSKTHKGKTISDEHKAAVGKAQLGRKPSEATRAKLSASLKGRVFTKEWKEKIRQARKKQVIVHSEETKEKMRKTRNAEILRKKLKV